MNAEKANNIDLYSILQTLGHSPVKQQGNEYWYLSPFRKEKTPSLHINRAKNIWYDFGDNNGGSVIDFVCTYLEYNCEDHTVVDALRWLSNMQPCSLQNTNYYPPLETRCNPHDLSLQKVSALQNPLFIRYLESRGIPFVLAKKYLKEASVHNRKSGKSFLALCIQNENGGYELRNKFFKGCIAPKGITFIRGANIMPDEVHVFEGFMDFLSALVQKKQYQFEGDAIILNSLSCINKAIPYISNYSYKILYAWFDNDAAGEKESNFLRDFTSVQGHLRFRAMNELYAPYKDVNEWHMSKLQP